MWRNPVRADDIGMDITPHAAGQAASRDIPVADIVDIAYERLTSRNIRCDRNTDAAILIGYAENGGWQGASNGNVVWAIIRGGTLATVMYRREDQPSTPQALRVRTVIA